MDPCAEKDKQKAPETDTLSVNLGAHQISIDTNRSTQNLQITQSFRQDWQRLIWLIVLTVAGTVTTWKMWDSLTTIVGLITGSFKFAIT